jgi:galactokinase
MLGVQRLRDAPADALDRLAEMPLLLARRARHVITENARVLRAREALLAGDLRQFGLLLNQSHESLRDDYEVSVDAVDRLVELSRREPSVFGARMTGGGFGGAIVVAVAAGNGRAAGESIVRAYRQDTRHDASMLVPRPA